MLNVYSKNYIRTTVRNKVLFLKTWIFLFFSSISYFLAIRDKACDFEKISLWQLNEHSKSLPYRGSQAMICKDRERAKNVITAQSKTVYEAKEPRGYLSGIDLGRWQRTRTKWNVGGNTDDRKQESWRTSKWAETIKTGEDPAGASDPEKEKSAFL